MRTLRLWRSTWLLAVLLLAGANAAAQTMTDPTRPPAGLALTEAGDEAVAAPVLQSVMISPAVRTAIIGGETVKLGGKYGDARVVKISETEVVLRTASGTETLKMYPAVTINPVQPAPVAGAKRAQKKRPPAANQRGKEG
jgi:MSHA biogenesis protein MshK